MKKVLTISLASLLLAGHALADSDCNEPVAEWQPREALQQMIESKGWQVRRIKVDDGCYEVKGTDRNGNRFEAKYAPASLKIRELEIRFDGDGDASDYLDRQADSVPPAATIE
ncbi:MULTISPECIES: PepSY domain-containing protein [Halopseudomonas]|jgi:hypothetical protein|uniref:PepSY domain-containing protein n=2 Tax=Halopseudomonas TaxID=2901189 RepID=A0A1H9NEX9_9GAMM|nr:MULTISPECIES: PepSY domain-containing protein [Halopseudomonas]SER34468.1 hypothetical protein SAMN05216589_0260 [Halopseudomonas bauzanensis]SFL81616.1 hypothetical protein SAMN04487855_1364 [Halopseudomonas bauzanensis]SFQ85913.1 hypothetical protein SAMN05216578_10871 [Halopseudomonas formosensis]